MEVIVQPQGKTLVAEPGSNLLQLLISNGVPVSHSCMAGRCGTCRCKVLQGSLRETGREAKITNPHEDPHVLACMSTVTGNCAIEIPEPDEVVVHPAKVLKTTVIAVEAVTHDIRRLRLRSSKPWSYSPGQYASLQFTREHIRPYSMAGLCGDDEIEFHVRLVPNGRVTSYIDTQLKVGDSVRLSGPMGTAYLRTRHAGPIICVAGGTGLAPVLSILRGAVAEGMPNPIHVYFGVRTPEDIYGLPWLRQLTSNHPDMHLHIVVSSGATDPEHRRGFVTDVVTEDWSSLNGWRGYLCGSPPMVEAATILLKKRGVPPEHIHADAFYTSII